VPRAAGRTTTGLSSFLGEVLRERRKSTLLAERPPPGVDFMDAWCSNLLFGSGSSLWCGRYLRAGGFLGIAFSGLREMLGHAFAALHGLFRLLLILLECGLEIPRIDLVHVRQ
jgi:hypothetical protein